MSVYDKIPKCSGDESQADVAQVVAHLIGSEEVTGPSPVISLTKPQYSLGFFIMALAS